MSTEKEIIDVEIIESVNKSSKSDESSNSYSLSKDELSTIKKLNKFKDDLIKYFKEREDLVEALFISALSNNHLIIIGPPGTAKSYLIKTFSKGIRGYSYFEWQVTKFSKPEELFGVLSLAELRKDNYKRKTTNKLPECEIAYIDEVFNANSSILNSLNQIMNERIFEGEECPLISLYGATNFIPEENILVAFFDRFLFKILVDNIHEKNHFKSMLISGKFKQGRYGLKKEDIENLKTRIDSVDISKIINPMVKLWMILRSAKVIVSDRRFKWSLKALQAKALMQGRMEVLDEDMFILKNILWSDIKDIPILEAKITKAVNPIIARIREFYDQAQDIEKQMKPLDPSQRPQEYVKVNEAMAKLKIIIDKMKNTIQEKNIRGNLLMVCNDIIKNVANLYKKILKEKLGAPIELEL